MVRSTSASGICFVGDTPAKIGALTHQSYWSSDKLSVLILFVNAAISSPQVVLSRSPLKTSERCISFTVFLLCLLHFVWEIRLGYVHNTLSHCRIFCTHYENSFLLDTTTEKLSRVFTTCFHPVTFYGVLTTGFHSALHLKFRPLKWPASDRRGAMSWHAD